MRNNSLGNTLQIRRVELRVYPINKRGEHRVYPIGISPTCRTNEELPCAPVIHLRYRLNIIKKMGRGKSI